MFSITKIRNQFFNFWLPPNWRENAYFDQKLGVEFKKCQKHLSFLNIVIARTFRSPQ